MSASFPTSVCAEAPELFVLEDGTDCHRMREKKVKKNKRSSSSQNNPYL